MDLGHVAFAGLSKFDGRAPRQLSAAELAQIAGRAGRHMADGSFGTTAEVGALAPEIVEAIENHRFEAISALRWRNSDLNFHSIDSLRASLDARSPDRTLIRAREAEDQQALAALAQDEDIRRRVGGPATVRLLWEVCQIPDFRKVMSDTHARLLGQIFRHLTSPAGKLPTEWVASHVARLDNAEGDIDTLMGRIAHIRTWTYISHRAGWLADPSEWQERTRAIEDKLSDALHRSLTQRFVDRRQAHLLPHEGWRDAGRGGYPRRRGHRRGSHGRPARGLSLYSRWFRRHRGSASLADRRAPRADPRNSGPPGAAGGRG
jgi:ATP-dependent RNA helicase SUPV3L1/SUV3